MLAHARDAEVVDDAADRQHGGVVGQGAGRQEIVVEGARDAVVGGIGRCRYAQGLVRGVEPFHPPQHEIEAVALRLGGVAGFFLRRDEQTRGDLMQPWLPDVGRMTVDQGHPGAPARTRQARKPDRQFQPAGPPTDDGDPLRVIRFHSHAARS